MGVNKWDADAGRSQAVLRWLHGTFLPLALWVERQQQGRQDGASASTNVGNCFVIPFSELGAVSRAEWMEIASAQFGGDVEIS